MWKEFIGFICYLERPNLICLNIKYTNWSTVLLIITTLEILKNILLVNQKEVSDDWLFNHITFFQRFSFNFNFLLASGMLLIFMSKFAKFTTDGTA